jgi:hypothetical protein
MHTVRVIKPAVPRQHTFEMCAVAGSVFRGYRPVLYMFNSVVTGVPVDLRFRIRTRRMRVQVAGRCQAGLKCRACRAYGGYIFGLLHHRHPVNLFLMLQLQGLKLIIGMHQQSSRDLPARES